MAALGRRDFRTATARGVGSPEFTELGAPGVKKARAWVCKVPCVTGKPPRLQAGLGEALDGVATIGAARLLGLGEKGRKGVRVAFIGRVVRFGPG